MGGRNQPREAFNAISLVLDAREQGTEQAEPTTAVLCENASPSPLRHVLEKRSSSAYLVRAHAGLVADGLTPEASTHALATVTNWPALAVRGPGGPDKQVRYLQAVVLGGMGDDDSQLVVLSATVALTKPPEVVEVTANVLPVNLKAGAEDVVEYVERWSAEYQVRSTTAPPAGAPDTLVWLGDPAQAGYREIPPDWQARVRTFGAALGMKTLFTRTTSEAVVLTLPQGTSVAIVLSGASDATLLQEGLGLTAEQVVQAGQPGTDFEALLRALRAGVVRVALDATRPASRAPRELKAGESVYHRKVGDGGGNYDLFDEGSPTPCSHGAAGYERFGAAEKAFKGMLRRYTNFQRKMLYHCGRYPNCGVYCARRGT